MKRLMTLSATLLLSALLALPVLAANEQEKPPKQLPEQAQAAEVAKDPHETEAFKRQQAYVEERAAMKQRSDAAIKVREQNIKNNSPGNTGL